MSSRQRAQGQRRQTRRPRHHLPAHDPGSGLRHARLRAHRRHSFRGVRRLLAGLARGTHRRLQVESSDHGRRGSSRRPQGAAQGQCRRRRVKKVGGVDKVLVVKHTGAEVPWTEGRDLWLDDELAKVGDDCPAEEMNAEDPLFILYTSGSTGQPKGVLHTSGGYLVFASMTHQYVFDYHDGDIYWCTADVGWVTGHSYIVYGPLANGATTLMFEGVPNYPDASRFWQVVDKHKVNIFYTAPTAIRALMGVGDDFVKRTSRKSLEIARQRRRADQSRSLGVVLSRRRRRRAARSSIPGGRPRPAASSSRRCPAPPSSSRARRRSPSSVCSPRSSTTKATCLRARQPAISSSSTPGRESRGPCTATTSASSTPTSRPTRASISPATEPGATTTAITGSRGASTT